MQIKVTSNTLYSRHLLSHRDSPTITEHARSPFPFHPRRHRRAAGGGGGLPSCAEWQVLRRQSQVIHFSHPISSLYTMPSRAEELFAKAEKKAASSVGWFGSSSSKWEEAADLFSQVSPSQFDFTQKIQHLAANREHIGCRRIQDRQQVARVRPGLRKVRLWYTMYMSMHMYVYTWHVQGPDRYIGKQHVASV